METYDDRAQFSENSGRYRAQMNNQKFTLFERGARSAPIVIMIRQHKICKKA